MRRPGGDQPRLIKTTNSGADVAAMHTFIMSESSQILQFLLTLAIIAVLVTLCVQISSRLRILEHENMQLKFEMDELQTYTDRSLVRMQETVAEHADLLKTGTSADDKKSIDAVKAELSEESLLDPSVNEVRLNLATLSPESAQYEPLSSESVEISLESQPQEVDVLLPLDHKISNIKDGSRFRPEARVFESGSDDEDPDPLTRAIKLSKSIRG
ncbi:hypothetical protein AB833_27345 [Chromatiales bacterium (ex Bugula neritina AB1)]|nr:hypothetical protein AB833_27345 [Chromatiales bacterium (ex Bugula neritina AB1)]